MSYYSSWLVKHFHFLLCDPIKTAGRSLPVNTLKQSWHSHAMSSSIFSISTSCLILGFFTNWVLICSWSLPTGLLGNTEQDFQVSPGRAALSSACSHTVWLQCCWPSLRGAVWVYGVRGSLFSWRMVPFPQHSPGCGQGLLVTILTGGSDPSDGWLWNLSPHAEVECPREQRDKCTTSSSPGKVRIWILASLFTSLIQQWLPTCCDCNIKMTSEKLHLYFT